MPKWLFLAIIVLALSSSAYSIISQSPAALNIAGKMDNILAKIDSESLANTQALPQGPLSSSVIESDNQYTIWANDFNKRIYEWQFVTTRLLFFVVILLVLFGVYLSWIQFMKAIKRKSEMPGQSIGDNELETDIDINPKGIKISSPVLGVIILTISLAFFYLYLKSVYPIFK